MPFPWNDNTDRRILLCLLADNLSTIKTDKKRLSDLCGGTTKDGVDHRFRVLKKEAQKILKDYENGEAPPPAVPAAPRTPRKQKPESGGPSPTKKIKKSPIKKRVRSEDEFSSD